MNDLQKTQLNILKEFDRVCRLHKIPYTLAWGTAIGAVRHEGFIPWDDDIDVAIMRNDFKRFEAAWKADADSNMFLQSYESDPEYHLFFPKIRDNRTTHVEKDAKHLKINHGIFIDITLFDYVPANKRLRTIQKYFFALLLLSTRCRALAKDTKGKISKVIFKILPIHFRIFFQKFLEKMIIKIGLKKSIGVIHFFILSPPYNYPPVLPLNFFSDLTEVPFEDTTSFLTSEYDVYLKRYFGDYMTLPPVKRRVPHHFAVVVDTERPYTVVWDKKTAEKNY